MKSFMRYFYLLIISILIAIIVYQCEQQKPSITECCPADPVPLATIDSTQARAKIDLYLDNQYEYISQGLSENYPNEDRTIAVTDSREVWFDLENLKEYICYVEDRSETLGYENLGLRVYFGATTDSDSVPRSTVFFWPTHRFEPQMMNTEGAEGTEDTDETINANSSENENSYNIKGLNYGGSGKPPKIFDAGN